MDQWIGRLIKNRYRINRQYLQCRFSDVFLGQDEQEGNKPVEIDIVRSPILSHDRENHIRFLTDITTISSLSHSNIFNIFDIDEIDGHQCLVTEFFDSRSLSQYTVDNQVDLVEAINIGIAIANALEALHQIHVIHRHVMPAHIFFPHTENALSDSNQIKLSDAGFAWIKDLKSFPGHIQVSEYFHYLAPEQLGSFNLTVDKRSDLYSLGVLLYYLASDKLPFQGTDFNSIAYQQISGKIIPPSIHNPNIPATLEDIILKLLEKEPEKRYQEANHVLGELLLLREEQEQASICSTKPAALNLKIPLVGREKELTLLSDTFSTIDSGGGRFCLVKGYPGIGKTSLIHELLKSIEAKSGVIIQYKLTSKKDGAPFEVFIEILDDYLKQFRLFPLERKNKLKKQISLQFRDLAEVLVRFHEPLSELVGEPVHLTPIGSDKEQCRQVKVVAEFILRLSIYENPLVIFIDDLHWIDTSSLEIINIIFQNISNYPLFFLANARTQELASNEALLTIIQNSRQFHQFFFEVNLNSLEYPETAMIVSSMFNDETKALANVISFISDKCEGNPFFIKTFVSHLDRERIISYKNSCWELDRIRLSQTQIPENIVETVINTSNELTVVEKKLLSCLAVNGKEIDHQLLYQIARTGDIGVEQAELSIKKFVKLLLLENVEGKKDSFRFTHDRIQEAFYQRLELQQKCDLHLLILKALERLRDIDSNYFGSKKNRIFKLAHHAIEANYYEKIVQYSFTAGLQAKEDYAYQEAIKFLEVAKKAMQTNSDKHKSKLFECKKLLGEIYLSIGQNDQALDMINQILPNTADSNQLADLFNRLALLYYKKGQTAEAERHAQSGMGLLRESIPLSPFSTLISVFKELLLYFLLNIPGVLSVMRKIGPKKRNFEQVIACYDILTLVYLFSDSLKYARTILRMLNISKCQKILCKELGMSMDAYGVMLAAMGFYNKALEVLAESKEVHRKTNNRIGIAQNLQSQGYVLKWNGQYEKSAGCFSDSLAIFEKIGDSTESGMSLNGLFHSIYYQGNFNESEKVLEQLKKATLHSTDEACVILQYFASVELFELQDNVYSAIMFAQKAYYSSRSNNALFFHCIAGVLLGILCYENRDYQKAIHFLEQSIQIAESNNWSMAHYYANAYCYLVDANLELLKEANPDSPTRKKTLAKIAKLLTKSEKATKNWITYHPHHLRTTADYYAAKYNFARAEHYFNKSIHCAKTIKRKGEEARSLFHLGTYHSERGNNEQAKRNWISALALFQNCGSKFYQNRLKKLLNLPREEVIPLSSFLADYRDNVQRETFIRISQDIASTSQLDHLVNKILKDIMIMTGYQRGFLIAIEDNREIIVSQWDNNNHSVSIDGSVTNLAGKVSRIGKPYIWTDHESGPDLTTTFADSDKSIKSVLCLPIPFRDDKARICYLDSQLSANFFPEIDLEITTALASQAFLAWEQHQIQHENLPPKIDETVFKKQCEHFQLSSREKEVVELVVQGLTNKEIAQHLFISHSTVRKHIYNINLKGNFDSRDELIRKLTQLSQ